MYFAAVAKEFITSGCEDGLPFQLEQLNPTETVSQSHQMREKWSEQTSVTKPLWNE